MGWHYGYATTDSPCEFILKDMHLKIFSHFSIFFRRSRSYIVPKTRSPGLLSFVPFESYARWMIFEKLYSNITWLFTSLISLSLCIFPSVIKMCIIFPITPFVRVWSTWHNLVTSSNLGSINLNGWILSFAFPKNHKSQRVRVFFPCGHLKPKGTLCSFSSPGQSCKKPVKVLLWTFCNRGKNGHSVLAPGTCNKTRRSQAYEQDSWKGKGCGESKGPEHGEETRARPRPRFVWIMISMLSIFSSVRILLPPVI